MEIVEATPDRWEGLARLFATDSGSDPRWCWCMYWRKRASDFSAGSAARNREGMAALVADGPAPGLLAVEDGRVIGWVAVAPRSSFERLVRSKHIPGIDERPAWSVVCFVVARDRRGTGVARTLLRAAVEHARANGAPAIEAYPIDASDLPNGRVPAAQAYTGTLETFIAEGFEVAATTTAHSGGAPRVVVRKELAGAE